MTDDTANSRSLSHLAGYGIGDFGLNIYWQTVSIFLLFWYTEVAGIDPRIAGTIFFIGMAWDAISDPIIASISERVDTRMGTYRPFLLFGSIFTAIFFVLLFWVPPFSESYKVGLLVITCLLFRTAYTVVAIPYSAMGSRISYDSKERADFSGSRMFFAFTALVFISMLLWPSVYYFEEISGSQATAFQITAAIGGLIATLALWLCYANTKELPLPNKTVQSEKVWQGIRANITSNKALRILLLLVLLNTAAGSALNLTLMYYITAHSEIFGRTEILLTFFALSAAISVPFWTFLIRKIGRRKLWIGTSIVYFITGLLLYFGPAVTISNIPLINGSAKVPVHIMIFMALGAAQAIIFWALIPDCVEYGQKDGGYRSEAGVYGSTLISQKLTGGIMAFIIGFVLSHLGVSESATVTSEHADSLRKFIAICPPSLMLLTTIPIMMLPMNRDAHKKIVGQLE